MKEFIDKLIEILEEKRTIERTFKRSEYSQGVLYGYYDAIKAINKLAEEYKGGWIPCKEEMPSKDGNYLVCDAQGNIYIARYYAGSTTFNRNVGFVARAWQPLPAPYTENKVSEMPTDWQQNIVGRFNRVE